VAVCESRVESGEVGLNAEDLWSGQGEELAEVEDLETVVAGLGTDVSITIDDLHVTPDGADGLGGKATPVLDGTIREDFNESNTWRRLLV
jgi:hypothetical protein